MASYSEDLHSAALAYHRLPQPGKLEIQAIKPLANQRDLALAYSPGVAAACMAIAADPAEAASLTIRANLVAVVSNGTAVLGLGNIGPLASKPVMEGKAVLFKKFAGIDVFDIEIAADTIERVVETVAALEPTFGGINLEDIKGPECFEIEAQLKARMKIPVFHDDQHGTAIIVGAAITNALLLNGKKLEDVKIVASGAGAAAIACLNLLVSMGAQRKNIWVCDIDGVVHEGRNTLMDRWKAVYAQKTDKRVLADVIGGADIFLGLSAPNVLTPDMVKAMADKPLVMALANPTPEIMPDEPRGGLSMVYDDGDGAPFTARSATRFDSPRPSLHAFWSVTMYDTPDFFLIQNPSTGTDRRSHHGPEPRRRRLADHLPAARRTHRGNGASELVADTGGDVPADPADLRAGRRRLRRYLRAAADRQGAVR